MAHWVKNPPAKQEAQETRRFDPWLEKILWRRKMAPHSSVLAWRIPWTEEPGGSEESQRAERDSVTMHILGTSSPLPQGPSINSLRANFWKASLSQDTAIFWKIAILYLFFLQTRNIFPYLLKSYYSKHRRLWCSHCEWLPFTAHPVAGLCRTCRILCGSPESGNHTVMTRQDSKSCLSPFISGPSAIVIFSEHVLGAVLGLPCGAWALQFYARASLVVAHGLWHMPSCPVACGILVSWIRIEPLHCKLDSLPLGHQASPSQSIQNDPFKVRL